MRRLTISTFLLLMLVGRLPSAAQDLVPSRRIEPSLCITNVAQFLTFPGADFLERCAIHLTGTVTLVDTNRHLLVLQDVTGAVAVNLPKIGLNLRVGDSITLAGTNCAPLFPPFPDYPFLPAAQNICRSFETPTDWGQYNLTRMRGFLHPEVTGDYRFWIASDNSSELWLSTDSNPANGRKLAEVPHFAWTEPHQWSKYSSQGSGVIRLEAGRSYFIEALQEQTAAGENLSVGWQGHGLPKISVIDGRYLTPWNETQVFTDNPTNGILREYWTNYFVGDVAGMIGPRPYESALTVKEASIVDHGQGKLPPPVPIAWNQPLTNNNYRWVVVKGLVKFAAAEDHSALLDVFDGENLIQVRALHWGDEQSRALRQLTNMVVQVTGVCEGVKNEAGAIMPACLWATAQSCIFFSEAGASNKPALSNHPSSPSPVAGNPASPGYFGTLGVVTFNARVFDQDYIFIQEDDLALRIMPENNAMNSQFTVGQYVDVGGMFELGKSPATIMPFFVSTLGFHSMPRPIVPPADRPLPATQVGRWCEMAGVAQAINANGTLTVMTKDGLVYFWLGETPIHDLSRYVDAKLRVRGVLMSDLTNQPVLLIPSRNFLEVVEEPPTAPFEIAQCSIASLLAQNGETWWGHRVRLRGEIIYQDKNSFFLQDNSGGIRVQTSFPITERVGEKVEVVAFPRINRTVRTLTVPLLRPDNSIGSIYSQPLNLGEGQSVRQNGSLVEVVATLLAQKTNGIMQVLELQDQQRVFAATLVHALGGLPALLPGTRLRVTGVLEDDSLLTLGSENNPLNNSLLSSPNILMRSTEDVVLLAGPPWWTWEKTAALVGMLLTIMVVAFLWVHLLQRRLQRQQAARFLFSQQVLGKLEEERRRIAANLHDSLGQALLVIKNHALLATQSPATEPSIQNSLAEISGTTSRAIEEVRRITQDLRPYQLDRLGLTQAIRASVNQAGQNGNISFAGRFEDIDDVFDQDAEIHVFRIVQEAVTNVVKHSAATEAAVVIKKRPAAVSLSIRDNGRGFQPAAPASDPYHAGFGLTGIGERVRILNGTLVVESKLGEGTSLTVEIPLKIS